MQQKPVLIYHHLTKATDAQGIHIHEMCRAFERLDWEVHKAALVQNEALGKDTTTQFSWLQHFPKWMIELFKIIYNIFEIRSLYRLVKTYSPQFIYERYSLYNIAGIVVAWWCKLPLILEINSPLAWEEKQYSHLTCYWLAQWIENFLIHHSFKTIAVSHELKRSLVKLGAPEDKIVVIPNGVYLQEYPAQVYINDYKLPDVKIITFVGWFRTWHRIPELIHTFVRHNIFEQCTQLWLVGDGPVRKEIEAAIAQYHVEKYVKITGPMDRQEVRNILLQTSIALQPAVTPYASPMKLIEYMAAGKAIVATDLPNIQELIQDGHNGMLFPDGDWGALSQKVVHLLHHPELVLQLGKHARATIESRPYTWDQNAKEVLSILGK